MSNKLINLVYARRFGSVPIKAVAVRLADVARDDGTRIYPSLAKIARETELCERAVRLAMRRLQAMGVLVLVAPGGGRNRPTIYRLDIDALNALALVNPAPHAPFIEETRHVIPQNPAPHAPNPLLNPYSTPTESGDFPGITSQAETLPPGRGANAPTRGSIIWNEALALLRPYQPEARARSLIGKWAKRTRMGENPDALLSVINAAKRAGTADPVSYIEAALAKSHPLPPDPASLDNAQWSYRIQAALTRKEWSPDWGPRPGERKCCVPASMITPQLLEAVGMKKAA